MNEPTLTQRLLLRDVAKGGVVHVVERRRARDFNGYTGKGCTVRMRELVAAGWVALDAGPGWARWRLTDAGRAVLDTHGGAP